MRKTNGLPEKTPFGKRDDHQSRSRELESANLKDQYVEKPLIFIPAAVTLGLHIR
jgi:hypothetical protein